MIIPAYSFDSFQRLPTELRIRVSSFASRFEDPQTHLFDRKDSCRSKAGIEVEGKQLVPSILHVCQESRIEALKVFTLLPTVRWGYCYSRAYFNTIYDSFYLGHAEIWKEFRLLIDILIKHNTTRALPDTVLPDMEQFKEIRHLIVDLRIFGAMPPKTWTEFTNLDVLTVAFYPFDEDEDDEFKFFEEHDCPRRPGCVRAHPRNLYGLHAKRLLEHVTVCIGRAKDEAPGWKTPSTEVKKRRVSSFDDHDPVRDRKLQESEEEQYRWFDELDGDSSIEAEDAGEDEPVDEGVAEAANEGQDQGEDIVEEDDIEDHDQTLLPQMPFEVPMTEIRRFKHKFHPSRRATTLDLYGKGRRGVGKDKKRYYGQPFTDSETEYGGASNHADYDSW